MARVVERVTLELGRGDGWLARRPDGLFWTPSQRRPDALLAAFLDASDGRAATTAVTSTVVAAGMAVDPFAVVTWSGDVHVVVMGAVEVCTDAPSMPMLSAGRSRTWVEHRPGGGAIALTAGAAADEGTVLDAGVVRAGGFRAAVSTTTVPTEEPSAEEEEAPADVTEPEPEAVPAPPTARLGLSLLRSVTGGDWMEDSIGIAGPAVRNADDTVTPEEPLERPPGVSGAPMIVVDGTPAVELDEVVIIGRQPDPTVARVDDAAVRCTVTGDAAVSRTHLVVRSSEGGVTVIDCGSRSGSALIAPGRQPLTMEPWTPYDLGAGDAVRLGGSTTITISR